MSVLQKPIVGFLCPINHRCISSFISKKKQKIIDERKIKENRRLKKLPLDDGDDLPIYSYASTNRNPISRVYTWGMACYGALGNPELTVQKRKKQKKPNSIHHPMRLSTMEMKKVKDVACGYGFTVFAANDAKGNIY